MKKINSKNKGKNGELEFCELLRSHGFEARRGQQYCGANGDADVICSELDNYHFEIKRTETFNLKKSMAQAESDAISKTLESRYYAETSGDQGAKWEARSKRKVPVVMHRYNRGKWMAIIDANEFLGMVKYLEQHKKELAFGLRMM